MEMKLSKAERKDRRNRKLCALVKENDLYAQTRLLIENEGLVVQLAKSLEVAHELDVNHYAGIELDDIIQEGRIAMLEAAKNFNPEAGTKFSSFAYAVMRNAMSDLCKKGDSAFERKLSDNGIRQIFLDDNETDSEGISEVEKIPDGKGHDPVGNLAVLRVMLQKMRNRLEFVPAREQRILMYLYGLKSLEVKTYAETAAYFHLSEKYLKEIEARSLSKLREGMNDGKII